MRISVQPAIDAIVAFLLELDCQPASQVRRPASLVRADTNNATHSSRSSDLAGRKVSCIASRFTKPQQLDVDR